MDISRLPLVLRRRAPDWDVRNYGVSKRAGLSGLLNLPELSELFELVLTPNPGTSSRYALNLGDPRTLVVVRTITLFA